MDLEIGRIKFKLYWCAKLAKNFANESDKFADFLAPNAECKR